MKPTAMCMCGDPRNIKSYALLMDLIMKHTADKFNWVHLNTEKQYGADEDREYYTSIAMRGEARKLINETIPKNIRKYEPEFFFTMGDPQTFQGVEFAVRSTPYLHYFPLDNTEREIFQRWKFVFDGWDILIPMSEFCERFTKRFYRTPNSAIYPYLSSTYSLYRSQEQKDELARFKRSLAIGDRKVLLYVGRIGWRKNVEFLIGAFHKLITERKRKDVVLYLHSDKTDPASEFNLIKLIHAFDIKRNYLYITPHQKFDEGHPEEFLRKLYNMADIYVSTHGGEGFGLPFVEAMACKTPVVATDYTTIPEIVGDNERGMKVKISSWHLDRGAHRPFTDLDDFCDKIEYLLDNPSTRKKMGRNARKWTQEKFDEQTLTQQWLRVFDQTTIPKVKLNE